MLNAGKNTQETVNTGQVVAINGEMTQFELINAIYDSKILTQNKLTSSTKLVLFALARHYNPANDDFFPSYSCITEHTGISKKSVERAIKELVEKRFITYRTEKVNRYRFTGHFFAQLKMSPNYRQNDVSDQRQNVAQTNKEEKINKKSFFNKFLGGRDLQNHELEKTQPCGSNEQEQKIVETQQSRQVVSFARPKNFEGDVVGAGVAPVLAVQSSQFASGRAYWSGNHKRMNGYQYEKAVNLVNSHVPSVAETSLYLQELRSARREACAPIDFDKSRAIAWYNSLSPVLRQSDMAKKVAKKFSISVSA